MTMMESLPESQCGGERTVVQGQAGGARGGVVIDMILCCPLYYRGHPCRPSRPARWESFVEWLIGQMTSSWTHWGYLFLACLWLCLGVVGFLWQELCSLFLVCHLFPILAPWLLPHDHPHPRLSPCICSFCPQPGGKMAMASFLGVSSGFVWQLYVNQSFAELIFNALALTNGFWAQTVGFDEYLAPLWFLHWPLSASLPRVHIITKPSAAFSRSQASRRKNYNNHCELLWSPSMERVR